MKRYSSYQDSGVEWIGEIPSHWETTKIKYTTDGSKYTFIDGDWIESKDISESGIRYITTGNIGEGFYKEQGNGYVTEETFEKLNCTEVLEGDLLISRLSLPVGRSCIIPKIHHKVVTSVDNVILRPKDDFSKLYLNYQFNSRKYFEYTELISRGTTLTRISRGMLGNNPIIFPPLPEQQQIVQFLDTKTELIDTLIDKTQRKIELLKEKRTSLINEVVTKGLNPDVEMKDSGVKWIGEIPRHWKVSKIMFIAEKVTDGSHHSPETIDDGKLYVTVSNVTKNNSIDFESCSKISSESFDYLVRNGCQPMKGDVLLTKDGTIGRGLVVEDFNDYVILSSIGLIRFFDKVNPYYGLYYLLSGLNIDQMYSHVRGSGITRLTINLINNLLLILPPISEQQQIVSYLDEQTQLIDKTVSIEERRIELLKEYRQSLISEVVTGKINVLNTN